MIGRGLLYIAAHFAICTLWYAVLQKPLFILANKRVLQREIKGKDIAGLYRHGVATDMISASYLTALPLIVLFVHWLWPYISCKVALIAVETIVGLTISLSTLADTALYPHWRFKLDKTVFPYLKNLKAAFASVKVSQLVGSILILLLMSSAVFVCFMVLMELTGAACAEPKEQTDHSLLIQQIFSPLVFALCVGMLFVVIRGVKSRPNTPIITYFSAEMFLNHAALNPLYNLIYSLSVKDKIGGQFRFMDMAECEQQVRAVYPGRGNPSSKILKKYRPNILFIVWESLGSRFVESLGGSKGVTPNFEQASAEGVLFTNVDAGSFRTDRGLVCLLSGLPGQPTMSIMKHTRKLPYLPSLPKSLKALGYSTTAIHGGDMSVLHKTDYYISSGHDRLLGIEAFDVKAPRCRWGIQDHYMFEQVGDYLEEKSREGKPWYVTFQTLSSHQPYQVPYKRMNNAVENAFAYTDEAFGKLMARLKRDGLWDDTLVIVSGDHGLNDPDIEQLARRDYVKIPVLFTGGAVAGGLRIDTLMAQTDVVATLLGQLGVGHTEYVWSRDVLSSDYNYPFTFHAYYNGFLLHDERGYTDFDNAVSKVVEGPDEQRENLGRMIQQSLYEYIDKLDKQ